MKKINKNEPDFYKEFAEQNKPRSWRDVREKIGYDVREYMGNDLRKYILSAIELTKNTLYDKSRETV